MANVKYSKAARNDLNGIGDYISQKLQNPTAALNTVRRIQNQIDKLGEFPLLGVLLSSKYDVDGDYRYLICGKYLAFYRVLLNIVFIDRILYGKRDYITILFDEFPGDDI